MKARFTLKPDTKGLHGGGNSSAWRDENLVTQGSWDPAVTDTRITVAENYIILRGGEVEK